MRGLAAGSFGEISPFQVCGSSAGQKSSRLCENGRRGKRDQGGGGGEKQIGAARDRYICWGRSPITICWGRSIIFWSSNHCTNGFMMVFGLATISTNRQPLDPMVFQWFPMVANHWSNGNDPLLRSKSEENSNFLHFLRCLDNQIPNLRVRLHRQSRLPPRCCWRTTGSWRRGSWRTWPPSSTPTRPGSGLEPSILRWKLPALEKEDADGHEIWYWEAFC